MRGLAQQLGITLLFLPSSPPNLNLIARLWKFTKRRALCLLHRALREFGLPGAEPAAAQAGTIRSKLRKIGGRGAPRGPPLHTPRVALPLRIVSGSSRQS
ncbi:MAG: hypothetical protein AB7U20_04115 [Planctomycetaceae bacterium]